MSSRNAKQNLTMPCHLSACFFKSAFLCQGAKAPSNMRQRRAVWPLFCCPDVRQAESFMGGIIIFLVVLPFCGRQLHRLSTCVALLPLHRSGAVWSAWVKAPGLPLEKRCSLWVTCKGRSTRAVVPGLCACAWGVAGLSLACRKTRRSVSEDLIQCLAFSVAMVIYHSAKTVLAFCIDTTTCLMLELYELSLSHKISVSCAILAFSKLQPKTLSPGSIL